MCVFTCTILGLYVSMYVGWFAVLAKDHLQKYTCIFGLVCVHFCTCMFVAWSVVVSVWVLLFVLLACVRCMCLCVMCL